MVLSGPIGELAVSTSRPSGDPVLVGRSFGDGFVALTGDATNLYNSEYEGATSIKHASRSVVWLEPDHIVVYDRAETSKPDRFKRFWLQLPAEATIDGRLGTVRTRAASSCSP